MRTKWSGEVVHCFKWITIYVKTGGYGGWGGEMRHDLRFIFFVNP